MIYAAYAWTEREGLCVCVIKHTFSFDGNKSDKLVKNVDLIG